MNLKRIIAWVLLVLFVFTIFNLLFIGFYTYQFGLFYILCVLIFLFGRNRFFGNNEPYVKEVSEDNHSDSQYDYEDVVNEALEDGTSFDEDDSQASLDEDGD